MGRKFIRKVMRWMSSFRDVETVMDNPTDKDIRSLASYFLRNRLLSKGTTLYILSLRDGSRFLIDFSVDRDVKIRYAPKGCIYSVAAVTDSSVPLFYKAVVLASRVFRRRESFAEMRAAKQKEAKAVRDFEKIMVKTYRKSLFL